MPYVKAEENGILTTPFREVEQTAEVFQMEHNKALGLDSFLTEFY